jgi:hypothetical protein
VIASVGDGGPAQQGCARGDALGRRHDGRRFILTEVAEADGGDRCRGGEVHLSVFEELHGHSRKLRGLEVEVQRAPTCLSTVTRLQRRIVVQSGSGPITGKEEEDVIEVHHSLGQLFMEEGGKGLTGR